MPPPSPDLSEGRWPLNYLTSHGPRADPVTGLTWFLLLVSLAVILIFTVVVVWGAIARRQRLTLADFAASPVAAEQGGMGWIYVGMPLTIVTLVVALVWTMGVFASVDQPRTRPKLTLEVTGLQWWWRVRYFDDSAGRGFTTANEIHIPVGQPVLIKLRGGDVIHSFWVPALSGKTDTIPGRDNIMWLQADRPGVYRGQCTEYCGLQHANMGVFVYADEPAAFETWRRGQSQPATSASAPLMGGESLFVDRCGRCHAVEGTRATGLKGPDLTHLMSRTTLAAGTLTNTINNLSGWISDPQAQKPGARMPATNLSGPQLQAVVAYLETLH